MGGELLEPGRVTVRVRVRARVMVKVLYHSLCSSDNQYLIGPGTTGTEHGHQTATAGLENRPVDYMQTTRAYMGMHTSHMRTQNPHTRA